MAGWRLNWEPGTAYEYHPDSAHWVLVEIIDRVSGGDYRELLQERVTRPAGIDRPRARHHDADRARARTGPRR